MQVTDQEMIEEGVWVDDIPWFCEADLRYIQLPKALFTNPAYRDLSLRAKVCYALILERAKLSYTNNWRDNDHNVFVYYTLESLSRMLGCTESRCTKAYQELENAKLCKWTRQGQGKPSRVVVYPVVELFNLRVKTKKK